MGFQISLLQTLYAPNFGTLTTKVNGFLNLTKVTIASFDYFDKTTKFAVDFGTSTTEWFSKSHYYKDYLQQIWTSTTKLNGLLNLTTTKVICNRFWDLNYKNEWSSKSHYYKGYLQLFYDLNYKTEWSYKSHYYKGCLQQILGLQLQNLNGLPIISITKVICKRFCDLNYKTKRSFKSYYYKGYLESILGLQLQNRMVFQI